MGLFKQISSVETTIVYCPSYKYIFCCILFFISVFLKTKTKEREKDKNTKKSHIKVEQYILKKRTTLHKTISIYFCTIKLFSSNKIIVI